MKLHTTYTTIDQTPAHRGQSPSQKIVMSWVQISKGADSFFLSDFSIVKWTPSFDT